MPAAKPKAPVLDGTGAKARELALAETVFGAEIKPHLVHEAVRAELNARRSGTHAAKSRGLVAGGRDKPWRQKGTGRARAGTIRAPQFTGGGMAFPPQPRSYAFKVNRKEYKAALRAALTNHASRGTFGILADDVFEGPSTRAAAELLTGWDQQLPLLVVAQRDQEGLVKSFRNLERVSVVPPEELEVAALVWARSLLVSEGALETIGRRAGGGEA
jgi:large subunit ribosomal protein L4